MNGSRAKLEFKSVPGDGDTILVNVICLYAGNNASKNGTAWLNGTLPQGVTMFVSSTQMTNSGNTIMGSHIQQENGSFGLRLNHISGRTVFYIGFQDKISSTETGSLNAR